MRHLRLVDGSGGAPPPPLPASRVILAGEEARATVPPEEDSCLIAYIWNDASRFVRSPDWYTARYAYMYYTPYFLRGCIIPRIA